MVQPVGPLEDLERNMMSFTSKASGGLKSLKVLSDHMGLSQRIRGSGKEFLSGTNTTFHREEERAKEEYFNVFRRHGLDLPYGTQAKFRSQSLSFVSSCERFRIAPTYAFHGKKHDRSHFHSRAEEERHTRVLLVHPLLRVFRL